MNCCVKSYDIKKLTIFVTGFLALILSSCRSLDYADKYYNVKWTSNNPVIEFDVPNEDYIFMTGYLIDNDGGTKLLFRANGHILMNYIFIQVII